MSAVRPRIILHPGFHKTGTSSMQHFVWSNRAVLAPHAELLMLRHLKAAVQICAAFSRNLRPLVLLDLAGALEAAVAQIPPLAGRDLIVSCEGLSGHLPGWPGVRTYAAAPLTIAYVAGYLNACWPEAEVRVLLTTRDPESWLFSAWRHHLRSHRLRLDWPAFQDRFAAAADLRSIAAEVAQTVEQASVQTLALEESRSHPLGPGGALIDLLRLPPAARARLVPVGLGNAGPASDLAAEFLTLNLSDLSDEAVRARKETLATSAALGGWKA
jgi:hypothetical protein